MQHLSPEKIAALVDEPATHDERRHLEQCALCRADFIAVRRIVVAAGAERERPITPLVPWQQLASALREEGVLDGPHLSLRTPSGGTDVRAIGTAPSRQMRMSGDGAPSRLSRRRASGLAAAAALLLCVGAAGGRLSATGLSATGLLSGAPQAAPMTATAVANFRSPEEARSTLRSAEEVYSNAMMWLATNDSALAPRLSEGSAEAALNYRQRLEVLDAAMSTARRAIYEAPDDPVMNRYYLATLGAREVTLRRLTTVLPASQQVLEY